MKVYPSDKIKNVVLLGHRGVGKTTLAEAAAFISGASKKHGLVEEGNTICDYDKDEIAKCFSMNAALLPIEWEGYKINILDTPGYFDFVGEVKESVAVADAAIIVVSGTSGVEVGTERAWEYALELDIPKMIFVTDMDDDMSNLPKVLENLKETFGKSIAPFQVPIREDGHFVGFVNVVKMQGRRFVRDHVEKCDIPESVLEAIKPVREMIIEAVAETDELLLEKYFNEEEFSLEEIQNALHNGVLKNTVVPVLCGSGVNNIGVQVLLNSVVKYMPSPYEEHAVIKGLKPKTNEEVEIQCSDSSSPTVFVFKTSIDPFVGKISFFRVYSGVVKPGTTLYNSNSGCEEKIAHVYTMKGKDQIELSELHAGDIGVFIKLQNTSTCDTLCDKSNPIVLSNINFPQPLLSKRIQPKNKKDEDKLSTVLNRILEEDKTLRIENDFENRQELIYGLGEQHLEMVLYKLASRYNVDIEYSKPKIPYKETIKEKIKVQGKHKKQTGGHGQYGDVHMEFEPIQDLNTPFIFEEKIFGGAVPKGYFPAVEKGLIESVKKGVLAGYPVVGIKATLVDGSYHSVDSSELAFKLATQLAFKEGVKQAKPTILEPIVSIKVIIPEKYMGDIIGDLNKRRGKVLGMTPIRGKQEIQAEVPQAEMYTYVADLRSMTQGRGDFTMEFARYEEAPNDVQSKIIENSNK